LAQKEMTARPDFQPPAATEGGSRIYQVDGVERARAILALVAAGAIEATVRAGSNDVAVGQNSTVIRRIQLIEDAFRYQPALVEAPEKMPSEFVVLR